MSPRYVAVTGVCGFIGRHVTQQLLDRGDLVYGVDALTYAADPGLEWLARWQSNPRFRFVQRDIRDLGRWPDVDAIIHLAAETHVDNSLTESSRFIETNVNGTHHLLEMTLAKKQHGMPRFIHISTDEVYGSISEGAAEETDPLRPSSPYSASKAAGDMLVQAWGHTFGLPYTIVRPTNCFGEGQFPEKLVPRSIRRAAIGQSVQVHGKGTQTRQWLYVRDAAEAILTILDHPELPRIVNIGGYREASVMDVACRIADAMGVAVECGYERPGQDDRYAVDDWPLKHVTGWEPLGDIWKLLPGIIEKERQMVTA